MATNLIVPDPLPDLDHPRGREALERLRPTLAAIPPKEIKPLNVDPVVATTRVLGAIPKIAKHREAIARACNDVDLGAIDDLEDRVYAFLVTNAEFNTSYREIDHTLRALVPKAMADRRALNAALKLLVAMNVVPAANLPKLHARRGHLHLATDLLVATSFLDTNWSRVGDKVPFAREALTHAIGAAEEIERLVGLRALTPVRPKEVVDLRLRAWTLVDRGYEEARRGISHVRWHHGDAESITPSLRTHGGRKKKRDPQTEGASEPPATARSSQ